MSAVDKIDPALMMMSINEANYASDLEVIIKTNKGDIHLDLFASKTPKTAANFLGLAKAGYYDGLVFHRVIEDFMGTRVVVLWVKDMGGPGI